MIRITLSDSDAHHIPAVRALCEGEALRNPGFNGAEFEIEIGDCVSIEGCDEYLGTELLNAINDICAR